jgi:hypothetical protein
VRAINETGPRVSKWTCNATVVVVYGDGEDVIGWAKISPTVTRGQKQHTWHLEDRDVRRQRATHYSGEEEDEGGTRRMLVMMLLLVVV